MSQRILISYTQIYVVYKVLAVLVPSSFLICYIAFLAAQVREGPDDAEAVTLPFWSNFLYPDFLDRLTLSGIMRAFIQALGLTVLLAIILGVVFLVLAGKSLVR